MHGMSYVVWHKLVGIERCVPTGNPQSTASSTSDKSDNESSDGEGSGDETAEPDGPVSPSGRTVKQGGGGGRPRNARYKILGEYKKA